MKNDQFITEILENTIGILAENKNSIMSISDSLKKEREKKLDEVKEINRRLPEVFEKTKVFKMKDRKIRDELIQSSASFTADGYKKMEVLFNKANEVHEEYLKAEQEEYLLIRRRDTLELELKQSIMTIERAEQVAQQLMVSLSYLQTGLNRLGEEAKEQEMAQLDDSIRRYVESFLHVEIEKKRIARDLHDGPAQQIAGSLMNVELCMALLERDSEKGAQLLKRIKRDLGNTVTDIRSILFDLTPAPLEQVSLKEAICNMLHSVLNKEEIEIAFFYTVEEIKISKVMQNSIYRMIQELVNNIKKHAKATQVMLRMSSDERFVYIYLMDNGVGFVVPEHLETLTMTNKSYGICNICNRVKELKGTIKINSDRCNGTAFKIQLPSIKNQEE